MEFEEEHNNLRAIRLLYRLLEDNSLGLQNANLEDLVERARVLLKSMLDVAVERIFETHLKIIATQAGMSKTSCTFQQEEPVARQQLKSPMAANSSQSSVKYPACSKITSLEDEQPQLKLLVKKAVPGLSNCSISGSGGTNSKTLCSVGEESSMMQLNLVKATNLSNEKGILPCTESSHHEQHRNNVHALYGVGEHAKEELQMFEAKAGESNEDKITPLLNRIHEVQCNSSGARQVESPDLKGDFSNDVVNAIKRIESRIFALQLCSNLVDSTKNGADHRTMHKAENLDSPVIQRNDGTAGSQLSCGRSLLEGNSLMNPQTCQTSCKGENLISANAFEEPFLIGNESLSQVAYQNHRLHTTTEPAASIDTQRQVGTQLVSGGEELRSRNRIRPSAQNMAMIDRVQSLNRFASGNSHLGNQANECIQGLRVPLNQDDITRRPSVLAGQTTRENLVRKTPVVCSETNGKVRKPESSYAQKLVGSTASIVAKREKPPPHQMVIRPTLLDQRSSEIKVFPHWHRDRSGLKRRGIHKTGYVEPLKTRVRPHRGEPEEFSTNSGSSARWTSQQGSANSNSDSEDYSLPGGTLGSTSGSMVNAEYEGSSEDSSNSYNYNDVSSSSYSVGSLKSYTSHHRKIPEKTIGHIRRLKNKLGLIFHHYHHHHHHHHHHNHHDDGGGNHSKAGHRHPMWNQLQKKIFHPKNKHGLLTKRKVEKTRRGTVARVVPRRNQVGQFHRLMEGLLRHIRHSRKSKPSKLGGIKGSKNTSHGHSQKKLHWWQMLRYRRRMKLKNRGRVRMGFISHKSLES